MVELRILVVSLLFYTAVSSEGEGISNGDVLKAIDAKFDLLINEINQMKEREVEQQIKLDLLTAQLDEQKKKTQVLEDLMKLSTAEQEKSDEKVKSADGVEDLTDLTVNSILVKKQPSKTRRQSTGAPVAFFALLGGHLIHAGVHQDIVFEKVETNEGGGYSSLLGTFTAPVAGTYVFSVTLTAHSTITAHFSISKNHNVVSWLIVNGQQAPFAVASQTDILMLQKGDIVTVQNQDADKNLYGLTYSSFAGFLLHENDQMNVIG